ncbi:MAG: hypothetical protein U0P45_08580 [Acidimicrobiales bacterium]
MLIGQIDEGGPTFFLLALCILVAQRAYLVARAAPVPTVVGSDDELIERQLEAGSHRASPRLSACCPPPSS